MNELDWRLLEERLPLEAVEVTTFRCVPAVVCDYSLARAATFSI
jgi:hypothetical protein